MISDTHVQLMRMASPKLNLSRQRLLKWMSSFCGAKWIDRNIKEISEGNKLGFMM